VYRIKAEYRLLGIKYFKTFEVVGHFTEEKIGDVMIRPRLVIRQSNGNVRVIPAIDLREYIVIGGKHGTTIDVGERGEQTQEAGLSAESRGATELATGAN
jgi:hypothetical protein